MKRSQFILGLLAVAASAAACDKASQTRGKLVGRWRDGDTTLEFKQDGGVRLDYQLLRVNAQQAGESPSARVVQGILDGHYTSAGDAITITDDADPARTGTGSLTPDGRFRLTIAVSAPSETGAAENVEIRHTFEREAAI